MALAKETLDVNDNQMRLISDSEEILKFLEFIQKKSIFTDHAIQCRLSACKHLFTVLETEEDRVEYILNHLDLLIQRYHNRNPKTLKSTLKVYKSRVKSSLEDFLEWSKDPFGWEKTTLLKQKAVEQQKEKRFKEAAHEESKLKKTAGKIHLSLPLRKNTHAEVILPSDGITLKELLKMSLFLLPYCKDFDKDSNYQQLLIN